MITTLFNINLHPLSRNHDTSTYPTALSAKFRIYFLDSILPLTTSATCLILPTRSTMYADRPETFSRCIHGVLSIAAKAGSQADSSSRSKVMIHCDMTLSPFVSIPVMIKAYGQRNYLAKLSRSASNEISSRKLEEIVSLILSSNCNDVFRQYSAVLRMTQAFLTSCIFGRPSIDLRDRSCLSILINFLSHTIPFRLTFSFQQAAHRLPRYLNTFSTLEKDQDVTRHTHPNTI